MMNHFTTASVFCIASLIAATNASAQQCTNGQCRQHTQPAASITNLFRLPGLFPSRTPVYSSYTGRNPKPNSACADGRCGVRSACRDCGCDTNGQNCKCGPGWGPHVRIQQRPELQSPRPQIDDRDFTVQAPRPTSGVYRPVSLSAVVEWENDIRTAADRSRVTGQPMLIQVSASWCGYCQQMKRETYTNQGLISGINRDFVAVSIDADTNRELVESMSVKSLPTTLVVLPNLQIVDRLEGFQSASQLQSVLSRHMQRAQLDSSANVALR